MNIRQYINIFFLSITMLSSIYMVKAEVSRLSLVHCNASNSVAPLAEEEKNITNVKVAYNPIAEQITVSLKLAKQNQVILKLMDALGNEVLNLSNSSLDAGNHSLSFDLGGKITPGFYFVRVSSSNETVVKRISIR